MLEPAASLPEHQEEIVLVVRQESPEAVALFDEFGEIARRGVRVPPAHLASADHVALFPGDDELTDGQVAGEDRRVDQRLVVGGAKMLRRAIGRVVHPRHRPFPRRRQDQVDLVRPRTLLDQGDERRRTVQHAHVGTDVIRRDRSLIAEDAIGQNDCGLLAGSGWGTLTV